MALLKYATADKNTAFSFSLPSQEKSAEGQGKLFKIHLDAGDNLLISNYNATSEVKTYMYNSAGLKLGEGGSGVGDISYSAVNSGDYFVQVGQTGNWGTSTNKLTFQVNNGAITQTTIALDTSSLFVGTGFTQAQVDAQVTAAKVGLFTQTEVTAQVTAAKVGLFTQVQLDAAVQLALHPIVPVPPTTAAFTNPLTLDKTDAANVVTLYKASSNYTATVDNTEIKGNTNANTLTASTKAIKISGGAGNDSITGSLLADTLTGDAGSDLINAGAGNDTVNGGADADTLNGQEGADSMLGGSGNDTMSGGTENDIIKGEAGDDTLSGDAGDDVMSGDAGNDIMSGGEGVDSMLGGAGNDVLNGNAGNDALLGEAGNDTLNGGEGDDVLTGAAGNDTLNGDAGADTLIGDAGIDVLNGGAGIDVLKGGTGDDVMNGGDDADVMTGGEGIDVMTGGAGADTFVFNVKDSNIGKADTITDYTSVDIIKILAANNITMLGNYEPAIKGVAGVTLAKAAVNFPTANTAAFEIATGKLYINTDVDDVFEYSIQLTGVADASQITIESVPTMA